MEIYIPVMGIIQFLIGYALVGILLYIPLFMWQNRFISGGTAWNGWDKMKARTLIKGILLTMLAWPIIFVYNVKTEIEYRKKGYL